MSPCQRPEALRLASRLLVSTRLVLLLLGVMLLARLLLLLFYIDDFAALSAGEWVEGWWLGLRFDAATLARAFGIPLLLMNLPGAWFERRAWFDVLAWLCYPLALLLALVLAGDLIYFAEVHRHVSYEAVSLWADRELLLREAGSRGGALALFAILAAGLLWAWRRILGGQRGPGQRQGIAFLAVLSLLTVSAYGAILSERPLRVIDAFRSGNSASGQMALNGLFTATAYMASEPKDSATHHFFQLADALGRVRPEPPIDVRYPMLRRLPGRATGHNVVFILLESWDFKYVDSFSGNRYGATPEFDALARRGRKFTRFYAVGNRSFDGLVGTLMGVPVPRGTFRESLGAFSVTRIGDVARRHGYATLFGQSAKREDQDVDQLASSLGFDEYFGGESVPLRLAYPDREGAVCGWDYDMLMHTKEKIDRLDRPFIAYVFTGTTHVPYTSLPAPFSRSHSSNGEDGYLATLRYADWSIGEFMRAAAAAPWFKDTVFIFTADHTNGLQKGNIVERHHTPMLIYAPGIVPEGTDARVASQLDVLPTLFDVLGFGEPYAALGSSLLRPSRGEALMFSWSGEIGLVGQRAFVSHDLTRRLESRAFVPGVTADEMNALEQRLLSLDQVIFELTRTNRWAP